MKAISIVLLVLVLSLVCHGQQKPFGSTLVGQGGLFSNAFLIRDGFVLDSATTSTWTTNPQNPTKTNYRFGYNDQGKLISDSNLSTRADGYLDSHGHKLYKYRPRRSRYIYDERGRIDSIAYSWWIDSLWVPDSVGMKYIYSGDGRLIATRYLLPGSPRIHTYVYDGSGNLLVDTTYTGYFDTSYTYREYDPQNRLTLTRSSIGTIPSFNMYESTEYSYDSLGNVHSIARGYYPDSTVTNDVNSYLTFDESGRLVKDSTSSNWEPDLMLWRAWAVYTFTYDEDGRILVYGLNTVDNRYTYTPEGNLDTLVCMHPVAGYFFGAHIVDSYGNDITLPQYNLITKLYYRQLVTGIENHEGQERRFVLSQNYPNPFNPGTTIRYELPKAAMVRLSVYDILGRQVSVLVNERKNAGSYEVKFDGSILASGVYFYRLQAGSIVQTRKLLLVK